MDFGRGKFTIKVLNSEKVVHDMFGLLCEAEPALSGDES